MKDILIVEDNAIVAMHLKMLMEQNGYKIIGKFARGSEAISFLTKSLPDLVFMDIMLEDEIDGIQVTKALRQFSQIPVIFMSALTDQETLDQLQSFNNVKLASKPFVESDLVSLAKASLAA